MARFDRLLWPEPLAFGSIRIYTGVPRNRVPVRSVVYDLLDRTISYELASRLAPRTLYRVELPGHASESGPRAFDGGMLGVGPVPLAFSFFTQAAGVAAEPARRPGRTPDCDEVVELLRAQCGSSSCHGGPNPSMGLGLDTREALLGTALRKVARQTETAGTVGVTYSHPPRFGTAMPLLDPGSSATSYLIYKLLIGDSGFPECEGASCSRFQSPDGPERCEPVAADERQRLRDWFVRGEPMPLREPTAANTLDCTSFRALVRFVDAGAKCE